MSAEKKSFLWWIVGTYVLFLLIAIMLSSYTVIFFAEVSVADSGVKWNWGLTMFLAIIFYTIASFRMLGPTEQAARTLFGRPVNNVSSGFVFVPLWIFDLEVVTRNVIQSDIPDVARNIYREPKTGGDGLIPVGRTDPLRVTFGKPKVTTGSIDGIGSLEIDALEKRLTEEVFIVIKWRIKDPTKYITAFGNDTIEAMRQLNALSVVASVQILGGFTVSEVIGDYGKYNDLITKLMETGVLEEGSEAPVAGTAGKTETWGVDIESVKIRINLSRELNTAIQEIANKTAQGKAAVIEAEALKIVVILAGEAAGAAEKAVLDGRTAGLKKMMDDLGLKGPEVLGAETARGITNNPGQKTIIVGAEGFGKLAAVAGTVLEETLNRKET